MVLIWRSESIKHMEAKFIFQFTLRNLKVVKYVKNKLL